MNDTGLPKSVQDWIADGKQDFARWAFNGLGILYHPKQIELAQAIIAREAKYYDLDWANRAGKTTIVMGVHMHQLWYKLWLGTSTYDEWVKADYATLHTAPLNELAGRAHFAVSEITKGVSPAQRDLETGLFRPAPLASLYAAVKERDITGADHMVVKCATGAKIDFRSTEGKATRVEGGAWWLFSWDEWPATEGDPEEIRTVMLRLENRAADNDAPIILTGTRTPETEHIAKEFAEKVDDPEDVDWWGNHAARSENPAHNKAALARAMRTMDPEDLARTVLGIEGGVKNRLIPTFLVSNLFDSALPRFTAPVPGDGYGKQEVVSPWVYLHLWDLAIAAAENVGITLRLPSNWLVSAATPAIGVKLTIIPGSRTLTSAEIIHTIEETFLPYGGRIVCDTTDAHGINIYRELRKAGYPVEDFTFNERVGGRIKSRSSAIRGPDLSMIRKDRAINAALKLLGDGLGFELNKVGRPILDADAVAKLDLSKPFGALRLPASWQKVRDQLALLRPDNERQRKDAAMAFLMGADVIDRRRLNSVKPAVAKPGSFAVFAGGHR